MVSLKIKYEQAFETNVIFLFYLQKKDKSQ